MSTIIPIILILNWVPPNMEFIFVFKKNISPNVIIGDDGRRQVEDTSFMPYRAMTYIEFGNLTSTWSCSGGVIGRDLVVTNAHCVEESVLAATVVPGMNNNQWAYGHYRVTNEYTISTRI